MAEVATLSSSASSLQYLLRFSAWGEHKAKCLTVARWWIAKFAPYVALAYSPFCTGLVCHHLHARHTLQQTWVLSARGMFDHSLPEVARSGVM